MVAEEQLKLVKRLVVKHLFLVVFHFQILHGFQLEEMVVLALQLKLQDHLLVMVAVAEEQQKLILEVMVMLALVVQEV